MQIRKDQATLWVLAIGLIFPLFIQISNGIYNSPVAIIDSGGALLNLPLPISICACLFAGLLFFRNFRNATPAFWFVLTFVATMTLSLMFAGTGFEMDQRKILIALQFLLPTMGLVVGQLVCDEDEIVPRAFMWVLLLVVPFQILAGWWQGTLTLTHNLYLFSIYQHFQFVPVVFVAAFCFVVAHLWGRYDKLLTFMTLCMGVYVIASASFLAIGLYSGFVIVFFTKKIWSLKTGRLIGFLALGVGMVIGGIVVGMYYGLAQKNTSIIGDGGQYLGKFHTLANGKMPINLEQRLGDWALYRDGIIETSRAMLFGHVEPPLREVKTSAHNWYLDFVYNFGLASLVPLLALMGFTARLILRYRKTLPSQTLWLAALVAFMVLVDSNFKVTLRQPYPGIFAYFLWGLLLTRLRLYSKTDHAG